MSDNNTGDASPTAQIRGLLRPPLLALLQSLSNRGEDRAVTFFLELLEMLDGAESEEDLIGCMVQLSTCAFVGLDPQPESSMEIDQFLAIAEQISATMAVDSSGAH